MIAVVDYGRGNLRSVQKAFEHLGYEAVVTRDPEVILRADKAVLPGVGAFGDCMENLRRFGLVEVVKEFIASGKPFLGICLGLQLLFSESEEFGPVEGLGVVKGRVVRFPRGLKIPHMGWNQVEVVSGSGLFEGIKSGDYFYFVHSFYVVPEDESVVATYTDYGVRFASSICVDNIFATQFHPEKSQRLGLKVLDNFGRL